MIHARDITAALRQSQHFANKGRATKRLREIRSHLRRLHGLMQGLSERPTEQTLHEALSEYHAAFSEARELDAPRRAGRPQVQPGEMTRPITVTLPPSTIEVARDLGAGNVSAGVRRAVEGYREK